MAARKTSGSGAPPLRRRTSSIESYGHALAHIDKNEDNHATSYSPTAKKWHSAVKQVQVGAKTTSVLEGPELTAERFRIGVPYTFMIRCSESKKGKVDIGCIPKDAGSIKVKAIEGDAYECTITPKLLGAHEVYIERGGIKVSGSPFRVTFNPPGDASMCQMVDPLPDCIDDVPESDMLFCFSTEEAGEGVLSASVKPQSSRKQYLPVDISSGPSENHYHVQFTPENEPKYVLTVKYDRQHIPGSPFVITLSDASKCKAEGKGLRVAVAGQKSRFTVLTHRAGPGDMDVEIEGEGATIEPEITCTHDEVHKVSYTAEKPGAYTVSVFYGNMPIPGSPFTVTCLEPADASKCVVLESHLPTSVGKPVEMKIDSKKAGGGELAATATGQRSGPSSIDIGKSKDQINHVVFNPPVPDKYTVSVTWGGDHIPGSPFDFDLTPPNPSEVTIAEPPASTLKAGMPMKICFDCSKAGLGELTASCQGKKVGEVPVDVSKRSGVRLYDVHTTPPDEDVYSVHVKWGGRHIKGSPFSINLIPIDVTKITINGPTMPQGRQGPVELTVCTEGAGLGKLTAKAMGSQTGDVALAVKKISDDVYKLKFRPTRPDIYTLNVTYGGQRIPGSPYYINTNTPNPRKVKISEPTEMALNSPIVYSCKTLDAGAGELEVSCYGESSGPVVVDVSKQGVAQSAIAFTPTHPDIYTLSVQWSGKHIPGSPFRINLLPRDPSKVKVGELKVPPKTGRGEKCSMTVDCSCSGPGELTAECRRESQKEALRSVPVSVVEQGKDKYKVRFNPNEPDIYYLSVFFAGEHLPGSPFTINLLRPQPHLVRHISTHIPEDSSRGEPISIAFDVSQAGGGSLKATASGSLIGPVKVEVQPVTSGRVEVLVPVTKPDTYTVHVQWAGVKVSGSPFVASTKPPDISKLTIEGPDFVPATDMVQLKLLVQDAGAAKVKATAIGRETGPVPVTISKSKDKRTKNGFNLSFYSPQPDNYTFGVWFGKEKVPGSPFFVNTHPPDASRIKVKKPEKVQLQEPVVYVCDVSVAGHGQLAADCKGGSIGNVPVEVRNTGNAKYCVSPAFQKPDIYSLSITWSGEHVPGSPFRINLLPVDASEIVIRELHIPERAGGEEKVWLNLDCSHTGVGDLQAHCHGASVGQVPTSINTLEPEHYEISFHPEESDVYTFSITYSGMQIKGSPFTINLLPPHPENVTHDAIHMPNDDDRKQPISIFFDVSQAGSGSLEATASRSLAGSVPVKVQPLASGQVEVCIQADEPDIYTIHVYWVGVEVPGSPFILSTKPPDLTKLKTEGPDFVPATGMVQMNLSAQDAGFARVKATSIGKEAGQVPVTVTETSKDCYQISFHSPQPDIYTLGVWYGKKKIPASPFFVNTHPSNAGKVKVKTPGAIQCGEHTVYRCDISEAGYGQLAAVCRGKDTGDFAVNIERKSVTKYDVTLVFQKPDIYTLSLTWAGEDVPGSPFRINLLPVDAIKIVVGELHTPERAGDKKKVWIDLNCSHTGVGDLQADCHGATVGHVAVSVKTLEPEHYRICFHPEEDDIYTLAITYSETHIIGSPFTVNLIPPNAEMVKHLDTSLPDTTATDPVILKFDTSEAGRGSLQAEATSGTTGPVSVHVDTSEGEVQFVPTRPEVYNVTVLWEDQPVPGSPFTIDLRKPEKVRYEGPHYTRARELVSLKVDTVAAGPGAITADCAGDKSGDTSVQVALSSSAIYDVTFYPKREDVYKLVVYYDGKEVTGSPFLVDLHPHTLVNEEMTMNARQDAVETIQLPDEIQEAGVAFPTPDLDESPPSSPAELRCHIGEPTNLTIECEGEITATAVGDATGPAEVTITQNADGVAEVHFNPDKPDRYTLRVQVNQHDIPGSPFRIVYSAPVDASKCVVSGLKNLPAALAVRQKIEIAVDASAAGDSKLHVFVSGPSAGSAVKPRLTISVNEAIYRIVYTPTASGVHHMHLLWGDKPIPASPLTFRVGAGEAIQRYEYGTPFTMEVHHTSREVNMNAFCIHQETGRRHMVELSKSGDTCRRHFLTLVPDDPGRYEVHVAIDDQELPGSPYLIEYAKPSSDPGTVRVMGSTLKGRLNKPWHFTVDTRQAGGGELKVRASGPDLKAGDITILGKEGGVISGALVPRSTGHYHMDILWSGQAVSGSPLRVKVSEEPTPEPALPQVGIHPDDKGVFEKELPFEQPVGFRIVAATAGTGTLNIIAQGPGDATVRVDDNHLGTYNCELTPSLPGRYLVSVLWNDEHIAGSPYTLRFPSTRKSYMVEGLQLDSVRYLIGTPHRFRVECGDSKLKITCHPPDAAVIHTRPASQLEAVTGLYTCEIVPVQAGNHSLSVLYDDQHIFGSPFNVRFELPGDASKCYVLSQSIDPTDEPGTLRAIFLVSTATAGHGELTATIDDALTGERATVSITEVSDGRQQVQAAVVEGREYLVSMRYGHQHIKGSPFTLTFDNPPLERNERAVSRSISRSPTAVQVYSNKDEEDTISVWPERVTAFGPGLVSGFVGQEGNFTVDTSEGGHGILAVRVHGPKGAFKINMRRHPDSDRTILVRYDPAHVGQYTVYITWSDVHIPGSPFKVEVQGQQGHVDIIDKSPARVRGSRCKRKEEAVPIRPDRVTAFGPGLENGFVGQEGNFTVETSEGGPGMLAVRVDGPKGDFKVYMHRHLDREHTVFVHYDPTHVGQYTVDITWSGVHIPGSPFIVNVKEQKKPVDIIDQREYALTASEDELKPQAV